MIFLPAYLEYRHLRNATSHINTAFQRSKIKNDDYTIIKLWTSLRVSQLSNTHYAVSDTFLDDLLLQIFSSIRLLINFYSSNSQVFYESQIILHNPCPEASSL